ncbi:hypothetical protein Caka_3090 [Coraliomargarita akajimensis DSM 45221]|uniref:Uncharacterized protein n=2 Tax=Coraliomargarita TaxID=442430 RepID=D5EI63_CORAD|nr:hypothetical protein Caka_3090 [Coraliomargarita akajimensis DSM 45221]
MSHLCPNCGRPYTGLDLEGKPLKCKQCWEDIKNGIPIPPPLNKKTVPKKVHVFCAWQFLPLIIGGVLGLILAAIAYAINVKLYESDLKRAHVWLLVVVNGLASIALWLIAGWLIGTILQKL